MTGVAALVAVRFVSFAVAMLLLGAPLLRLGLAPSFADSNAARAEFDRWLGTVLRWTALVALVVAAIWLDLEAAIMTGVWEKAADPQTIETVFLETEFGSAWQWHMGFAAALLALVWLVPGWLRRTGWSLVAIGLAAAHAASLAWAGHGVMHPGVVYVACQAVHILAGAVWLGSLPALFFLLGRAWGDPAGGWQAALRAVLPRYSRAGYCAVGLVLLTGCFNSWNLVGSWRALVATDYGHVLMIKIALVALMVATALANRLSLAWAADGLPLAALRRNVALEQMLGVGVLAAVSLLGTLPPALHG